MAAATQTSLFASARLGSTFGSRRTALSGVPATVRRSKSARFAPRAVAAPPLPVAAPSPAPLVRIPRAASALEAAEASRSHSRLSGHQTATTSTATHALTCPPGAHAERWTRLVCGAALRLGGHPGGDPGPLLGAGHTALRVLPRARRRYRPGPRGWRVRTQHLVRGCMLAQPVYTAWARQELRRHSGCGPCEKAEPCELTSCVPLRWGWALYALVQGTMFWALFVIGHDWCVHSTRVRPQLTAQPQAPCV